MIDFDYFDYLQNSLEEIEGDIELVSEDLENLRNYCFYLFENSQLEKQKSTGDPILHEIIDGSFEDLLSLLPTLRQSQLNPIHEIGRFNQSTYNKYYPNETH